MARRRRTSAFEDMVELASRLPWWVALILALTSYLLLHAYAASPIPRVTDPHQMASQLTSSLFRGLATGGQYFLPLIFVFGAIGSAYARFQRRKLLDSVASATQPGRTVDGITWREFEMIVGETMRRQGFSVTERGGDGPDGGVDLELRKSSEKYLVQCKHWRTMKVGLAVVREFFGAMAAEGAVGGFVVTSGSFTSEAKAFASGRNIKLVDGVELSGWIAASNRVKGASLEVSQSVNRPPSCPLCKRPMVIRTAKRGLKIGEQFWGCVSYPACKGVVQLVS